MFPVRVEYGDGAVFADVTFLALYHCLCDESIVITSSNQICDKLFGDPLPGVQKHIRITDLKTQQCTAFQDKDALFQIDEKDEMIQKVRQFHEDMNIYYTFQTTCVVEHPRINLFKQFLIYNFVPRNASVLEINAGVGATTMFLASFLHNPLLLIATEPDPNKFDTLLNNQQINGLRFWSENTHVKSDSSSQAALSQNITEFHNAVVDYVASSTSASSTSAASTSASSTSASSISASSTSASSTSASSTSASSTSDSSTSDSSTSVSSTSVSSTSASSTAEEEVKTPDPVFYDNTKQTSILCCKDIILEYSDLPKQKKKAKQYHHAQVTLSCSRDITAQLRITTLDTHAIFFLNPEKSPIIRTDDTSLICVPKSLEGVTTTKSLLKNYFKMQFHSKEDVDSFVDKYDQALTGHSGDKVVTITRVDPSMSVCRIQTSPNVPQHTPIVKNDTTNTIIADLQERYDVLVNTLIVHYQHSCEKDFLKCVGFIPQINLIILLFRESVPYTFMLTKFGFNCIYSQTSSTLLSLSCEVWKR